MNVELAILQRARALIEDFEDWVQGYLSEGKSGEAVDPEHPAACRFCSIGAVRRAAYDLRVVHEDALVRLTAAARSRGFRDVASLNDSQRLTPQGHAAVLALFDEAIAQAKEMGDE